MACIYSLKKVYSNHKGIYCIRIYVVMARHEQRFDLDSGPMNPRCTLIEGCLKLVGNKYFDTTPSLTKLDETFHVCGKPIIGQTDRWLNRLLQNKNIHHLACLLICMSKCLLRLADNRNMFQ